MLITQVLRGRDEERVPSHSTGSEFFGLAAVDDGSASKDRNQ